MSSLAAMLDFTCAGFRISGMIVVTSGLARMKRNAMSGSDEPCGTSGFSASARATDGIRFSGTKSLRRQSPLGQVESFVSVPVSEPSSNGTRAITPMSSSRQSGNSSSSGAWSKML